jgi:hypothetical protein
MFNAKPFILVLIEQSHSAFVFSIPQGFSVLSVQSSFCAVLFLRVSQLGHVDIWGQVVHPSWDLSCAL